VIKAAIFASVLTALSTQTIERRTAEFVGKIMVTTFMCQGVIGDGHYQMARTVSVDRLARLTTRADATRLVKDLEATLKARKPPPKVTADHCLTVINDLYFEYGDL